MIRNPNIIQKRFFNEKKDYVLDSIDGLVAASGGSLCRLDGYPDIKVVLRSDWQGKEDNNVAIISGGGSGHEPAHAGFVGDGLLTAAICGEIFASPSVEAILAAILAVTGKAGCLLIIKNYTGDRINFGLAAEKAKSLYGLVVEMVIVADDIALEGALQPRGLSGTLFIHKIAGAASKLHYTLNQITDLVSKVSKQIYTIGASLSVCTIPGVSTSDRLLSDEMELGLGIHGEPGAAKIKIEQAKNVVQLIVQKLLAKIPENSRLLVMINNLGSVSVSEMSILTKEITNSKLCSNVDLLMGPFHGMTALDMNGFSISCLVLDPQEELTKLLLQPTISIWPKIVPFVRPKILPVPIIKRTVYTPSKNELTESVIRCVCNALIENSDILNELDSKIGDGDTGTTFAQASRRILDNMSSLPLDNPSQLALKIGDLLSLVMGGSSGVLLSIFFTAAGNSMKNENSWSKSNLQAGLDAIMKYGGATLGSRTMLDSLIPAIDKLDKGIEYAVDAAYQGALNTEKMASSAGRSSYVPTSSLHGVADPGATAISIVFRAISKSLVIK